MESLVEGSDLVILPTSADLLSLDATRLTVELLQSLKSDRFKILITQVRPKPARDGEVAKSMLEAAGLPCFDGMIRRYQSFVTAASLGVLVSDVKHEQEAKPAGAGLEHLQHAETRNPAPLPCSGQSRGSGHRTARRTGSQGRSGTTGDGQEKQPRVLPNLGFGPQGDAQAGQDGPAERWERGGFQRSG